MAGIGFSRITTCAGAVCVVIALTGCFAPTDGATHDKAANELVTEEPSMPEVLGLDEVDLEAHEWVYRPGGNVPETERLHFDNGVAEVEVSDLITVRYELGEMLYADATGDGVADALAQVTRIDGNAVEEHWYLWVATLEGPAQVTLPVARQVHCGTAIESVRVVDGGFEVHEHRRGIGPDQQLPCSETGSDERVRVVSAVEARNDGEWWPIAQDPIGFGGLCPTFASFHPVPWEGTLFSTPDESSPAIDVDQVVELEGWPVYGEDFPGWELVGTVIDDEFGCAWAPVS